MASDIWLRTILIVRKETRCRHIGYSFRLAARVLLYAPSHRQDSTYHYLCYTSRGALAGTRNTFDWCMKIVQPWTCLWCHYTKSNPIDDHSNISSKMLQKQNFKLLGHSTCMQCGTSHLQRVQENILSHIIFSDLREVYSGNRQIHTKCQLQYLHPPPYINKWQMSLCNNSSDTKSY